MAEHILGILFVTSTSRGSHVFRYPPDPLSPSARLSQPIYPTETFTASSRARRPSRAAYLHPSSNSVAGGSAFDDRKSSTTSLKGSARRSARAWGEDASDAGSVKWGKSLTSAGANDFRLRSLGRATSEVIEEDEEGADDDDEEEEDEDEDRSEEGDSDVSDESDYDYIWAGETAASRLSPDINISVTSPTGTSNAQLQGNGAASGRDALGIEGRFDGPSSVRSGSRVPSETVNGMQRNVSGGGAGGFPSSTTTPSPSPAQIRASLESQYSSALAYSLEFLSDMLTPPRSSCNRKFELCVDELIFLGHPITTGKDGKWRFPDDEDADGTADGDRAAFRGRRGREGGPIGLSHLRTVVEASDRDSNDSMSQKSASPTNPTVGRFSQAPGEENGDGQVSRSAKDEPPALNMFHLVLILDKPDPKSSGADDAPGTVGVFDEVYREIVFKWSAAVWALQVKDNFVGRESWEMAKFREKAITEGISIVECCEYLYRTNPLERALSELFYAIHSHQIAAVNPLYADLPTTITVPLADMSVSMIISPKSEVEEESWAHWGRIDGATALPEIADLDSDDDSEDWLGELIESTNAHASGKAREIRVEPWQTLLLIDENAAKRAGETANAIVGISQSGGGSSVAHSGTDTVGPSATASPTIDNSRRGSKETSAEEDESALMKALIEACDVTKPLHDIAHLLRYDLDGIVLPLARELVLNKKAIPITVFNYRLRTVVMPTTISVYNETMMRNADRFARLFPTLPPLPVLLAQLSASTAPFRDLVISEKDRERENRGLGIGMTGGPNGSGIQTNSSDVTSRQPYFDALLWLLRKDLVVQAHIRVRVWASKEVKEAAWRKIWERRRVRWLDMRAKEKKVAEEEAARAKEREEAEKLASPQSQQSADDRRLREAASRVSRQTRGSKDSDDLITPKARDFANPMETADNIPSVPAPNSSRSQPKNALGLGFNPSAPTSPIKDRSQARAQAIQSNGKPGSTSDAALGRPFGQDGHDAVLLYDPDLEADSDLGEGEDQVALLASMGFSEDRDRPQASDLPVFEGSFVVNPARAQKDEKRWLRIIRERGDEVWASKFDLCVQYFDGVAPFEEIAYRAGLQRRELDWILRLYKEDLVTVLHP